MIRAGELEIAVAGGMESMTNAPYLVPKARDGSRIGDAALRRLDDPRRAVVELPRPPHGRGDRHRQSGARPRARGPGRVVRTLAPPGGRGVGRRAGWPRRSCRSRCRSARAIPVVFDRDEGIRPDTSLESLAALRPAFTRRRDGHRGQRVADLRRRGGRRRRQRGGGRASGAATDRVDRGLRHGGRAGTRRCRRCPRSRSRRP